MKKARLSLWISLSIVVLTGGFGFVATSRAGYETASYEIVKKDGPFEVRDYAAMVVVSTSMKAGGQNGSFGRLFKYISGENASAQKITMTTPVFMPASGSGDPEVMQFVVPASIAGAGTPPPTDPSVQLSKMKGGKYAVLRYKGRSSAGDRIDKLALLRARLDKEGLQATGGPIYAGYDPPWTPALMRRNEVLLRVK